MLFWSMTDMDIWNTLEIHQLSTIPDTWQKLSPTVTQGDNYYGHSQFIDRNMYITLSLIT